MLVAALFGGGITPHNVNDNWANGQQQWSLLYCDWLIIPSQPCWGGNCMNCTFNTYTLCTIKISEFHLASWGSKTTLVLLLVHFGLCIYCAYCTLDSTHFGTGRTWLASSWDETQLKVYIGQSLWLLDCNAIKLESLMTWTFTSWFSFYTIVTI